jgi:Methyltransferase domain
MNAAIIYRPTQEAWRGYTSFLKDLISKNDLRAICDVGGGANPAIDDDFIEKNGLDYCVLDISAAELQKAPCSYKKICTDVADINFKVDDKFDLIFSKMLAEHNSDAEQFHKNVLSCLSNKGLAVHFFPTLYAFPFIVNKLIPERLATLLFNFFAPRDKYQEAKFPALYQWCRGSTKRQIKKFETLGYEVVEYRGFFGHSGYYKKIVPIQKLHELKSNYLLRHPIPHLTSYAYVILRKSRSS